MEKIFQSVTLFIGTLGTTSFIVQAIIVFVLIIILIKTLGKYGIIDFVIDKFKKSKEEKKTIDTKISDLENNVKEISKDIVRILSENNSHNEDVNLELITTISKLDISINRMEATLTDLKSDIKDRDTIKEMNYKLDSIRDSAGNNW